MMHDPEHPTSQTADDPPILVQRMVLDREQPFWQAGATVLLLETQVTHMRGRTIPTRATWAWQARNN